MNEYPKALYEGGIGAQFEQLPCVVVNSREEEEAKNAEGWFEIGKAPASEVSEPTQDDAADELAVMREKLAAKGVAVDRRWGMARLKAEMGEVA